MAAHEKREARLRQGKVDVLLIGDSITAGWSKEASLLKTYFSGLEVVNLGHPADKTENILWRLRHHSFDGIKPGLAIVLGGTNNSNGNEYANEQIAGGVETILRELRARLPQTRVLLLGIFPRGSIEQRRELKSGRSAAGPNSQWERIDRINQVISSFANGRDVLYLNLNGEFLNEKGELPKEVMPDFLHPSTKGYEIWGRALQAILAEAFPAPRTPPAANTEKEPPPHPSVGQRFVPTDVDWAHPLYATSFDDEKALTDWKLEGGKRMAVEHAKLVLENDPGTGDVLLTSNHLVCWLTKEMPADFLLEFKVRPQDRAKGLNIVFFNARGIAGDSIFDAMLKPRSGLFSQYHSGDLNNYHISYWAGDRGTANVRKNHGFHLVATGIDLVQSAPVGAFQTIRLYKRGGTIRLMVDNIISVAFDDDGRTWGPVWNHSGWIGLRQMAHTISCEYDDLKVFPCHP